MRLIPVICCLIVLLLFITACLADVAPNYSKTVIPLEITCSEDTTGSLVAVNLRNNDRWQIAVTGRNYLGIYEAANGKLVWSCHDDIRVGGQSESEGLPGHHGPGVQAGDIDNDGKVEIVYLTRDGVLHVREGLTGKEKWTAAPPAPKGSEAWEHPVIVNLHGEGDTDIILQATNKDGYRMGRYVAAFRMADLKAGNLQPLWSTDDFLACAHNGIRVADCTGDGRDEIIGGTILGPEGNVLYQFPVEGHIDSVFMYDVCPDLPGIEVVALEEGGHGENVNRVFLVGSKGLIFSTHYNHSEPQNAVVGRFDPAREDLQVWCRSRFNEHQIPFVFDSTGKLIATWKMDDVAPEGWTASGVEVIHCIDWTGEKQQLAAAKERHRSGDICVFDPISGEFKLRIEEHADRIYVADVLGDWREEIIVWNQNELHIYQNLAENPRPDEPRLWESQNYKRAKMTWNYYSP